MKAIQVSAVLFALAISPLAAFADRDRDEGGHGRHRHGHEYKHEYWDGNCKVEIKQKKNGDYKEERKCRAPNHVHAAPVYVVPQPVVVAPQPVVVAPQPVYVPAPRAVEPSVTIRATIPIK